MRTELTYVNPFQVKEFNDQDTTHLRSPPIFPLYTLPSLAKIGGKLKEEEICSFPYLLDMAATVKVARTPTERP